MTSRTSAALASSRGGGVKVEDLAQSFEEPEGYVVVIGVGP